MKALVVYESLWGNTAAVARAIAEGLGDGARAVPTSEATPGALAGLDLLVAGSPVHTFQLPTEEQRQRVLWSDTQAPFPPDLTHPSMRAWLQGLPARLTGGVRTNGTAGGAGVAGTESVGTESSVPPSTPAFAAFETGYRLSPSNTTRTISDRLTSARLRSVAKGHRFVVLGRYGPLRDGELDKAHAWGAELARLVK